MSTPFDMESINKLIGSFTQKMSDLKEQAAEIEVEGKAGGDMVTVTANGQFEIVSVRITDEALEDRELLEDLVVAACNDAVRKAREEISSHMGDLTGGLPLPPGIL